MPSKTGKVMTVAPEFAKMINDGHENINRLLNQKLKKKMTKIDYTNFLAHIMRDEFSVFMAHGIVQPIKKGRKSKQVTFSL
jgi:formate dehydrogenase maturation protein FdhE